jgi:hypothetical protein
MIRGTGALATASLLIVAVSLGCDGQDDEGESGRPKLYVEINGKVPYSGITPGWFTHTKGSEAYAWCKTDVIVKGAAQYEVSKYCRGEVRDTPAPEQVLIAVYGCAGLGTKRLSLLVIDTKVPSALELRACDGWSVVNIRQMRAVEDACQLAPGTHVFHISAAPETERGGSGAP